MKKLFTLFTLALLAIPLAWGDSYVKVTNTTDLTSGQYLIVCENNNVAFNGNLTTLDAVSNTIQVDISDSEIEANSTTNAAFFYVWPEGAKFIIQSASGYYIGTTGNSNSLNSNTEYQENYHLNTISFDTDGNANIVSPKGPYLRYNSTSGQTRFRYFKSTTYTDQKAIQLYKLVTSTTKYVVTCNAQPSEGGVVTTTSSSYAAGETVDVTATPNDGYVLSSLVYNDGTDHDITSTKSFTMPASAVTVTGTFTQVSVSDLYILGMVSGNGEQPNQAVKMNYSNGSYNADIYVIGNYNKDLQANGTWFVFTDVIANDNDGGGWDYVNKNRYQPSSTTLLNNGTVSNVPLTHRTDLESDETSFVIPSGLYTVTVSSDKTSFSLTAIKDLKPTITPDGGSVSQNSTATVALSEDFNTFIAGCNPVVNSAGTTITITPPVATLYVNGTAVDGYTYDYPFTTTGSVTLTGKGALVAGGTDYAEKTKTATFIVTESTDVQYSLVTQQSQINEDNEYVFIYNEANAMGSKNSSNYRNRVQSGSSTFTVSDDVATVYEDSGVSVLTLEESDTQGQYYIKDDNGDYLYWTSGNNVYTGTTKGKWILTIQSDNKFKIQYATQTSRYLQYNSSSPRFACYESSSNQKDFNLYYRAANTNLSTKPTITPTTPTVKGGLLENVTITAAEGATIYYTTDGSDPTTSSAVYSGPFNLNGTGGQEVTVQAIAVETGKDPSRIATMTYTFQAPLNPTFSPTAAAQIGDFSVTIESSDGGTIYYLLDPETAPTNAQGVIDGNQVYSEAIPVTGEGSHTIYAAVNLNGITSRAQKTYTITYPTPAITVSPNGGTFTDTQEVTLSASDGTAPYTITYTINGGETQIYTTPFTVSATSTVVAMVVDAKGKTSTTTVTFTKLETTKYVRINRTDDLETDKNYLIVYENGNGAMGTRYNTNYRSLVTSGLTLSDGVAMVEDGCAASIFNLGGYEGAYTFYDGNYYLANTSGTQLNSVTNGTATTSTWSISFSGNNAVITSSTGNSISYATQYSDFNTGSANNIQLYKEVSVSKPIILPEGKTYLNSQKPLEVTITCDTEDAVIYYTTDGNDPTATSTRYTQAFTISDNTTVKAIAIKGEESSDIVSETYRFQDILVEPVVFSPIEGTYSGEQTLQMYSTTQNAKIYYVISESAMPDDPTTGSTLYSSTDVINMTEGNTYYVKAIAYVGNSCSEVTSATFTINTASSGTLNSIAELNTASSGTAKYMGNPFQIVYMNTWRHDDYTPEYAYVRDNSGYGLIYFGNNYYRDANYGTRYSVENALICDMGDWIPGNAVTGTVKVWSDGFHNELGGSNYKETITDWPTSESELLGNTPIIPEEMTNANINAGWTVNMDFVNTWNTALQSYIDSNNLDPEDWSSQEESAAHEAAATAAGGYAQYVNSNNVWGHYVHLRKNTIRVTNDTNDPNATPDGTGTLKRHKYSGFIKDQSEEEVTYYDAFYNFSGFNGTDDYSNDFFNEIQEAGATFDVYGIVGFYGPKAADVNSYYTPFELFPIDFLYIYKPTFNIESGTYLEPQQVELSCLSTADGATIWYKTSDMEDFVQYTGAFTIDHTTIIEAYSSMPTQYNDVMESVVNTLVINIGSIEAPVITQPSIVKTVGETTTTTITCETDGATIYYTTDGSDPKTSNTRVAYTTGDELSFTKTTTVRAIAYKEETDGTTVRGFYSAEAEARTYTFVNSNGVVYDLVTDPTQLNETSVYMVVNKANYMAMSTTQNTVNRGATGVQFVDDTKAKVYGNSDVALFTLEKVGNQWYLKALNGSGYFAVGDGNTLLTQANADGNAEATIAIDADSEHQAHISYVYNNETTRYLRYYNGGTAFSTYTSETSNLPVSLYYSEAHTLAWIEKFGQKGENYTVADDLQVVFYDGNNNVVWAKDLVDNINAVDIPTTDGVTTIDYMRSSGKQAGEWQQNNWVMLDFSQALQDEFTKLAGANTTNLIIKGGSLVGNYTDDVNYTIKVSAVELTVEPATRNYVPNVYSPANYGADETGWQEPEYAEGKQYWFMEPKVMEVCTHTLAKWNGTAFYVPEREQVAGGWMNEAGLEGTFNVGWTYNAGGFALNNSDDYKGKTYQFLSVVMKPTTQTLTGAPRKQGLRDGSSPIVYPLDLKDDDAHIITAVNHLQASREVVCVTYCDIAGRMSTKPFSGVNIIVTRYTDGTVKTTKAIY